MSNGLTIRDQSTIESILAKYEVVKKVYIFGSRAKGNFSSGSDVDLAIMNNGVTNNDLIRIKSDLDESNLPYFVDVVLYPLLDYAPLKNHIERVGKLIYESK